MVAAIRQTVTVQPLGTVIVQSTELRAGTMAEVIVLFEGAERRSCGASMEALDALQASLRLTTPTAQDWVRRAQAERQAFAQRP